MRRRLGSSLLNILVGGGGVGVALFVYSLQLNLFNKALVTRRLASRFNAFGLFFLMWLIMVRDNSLLVIFFGGQNFFGECERRAFALAVI